MYVGFRTAMNHGLTEGSRVNLHNFIDLTSDNSLKLGQKTYKVFKLGNTRYELNGSGITEKISIIVYPVNKINLGGTPKSEFSAFYRTIEKIINLRVVNSLLIHLMYTNYPDKRVILLIFVLLFVPEGGKWMSKVQSPILLHGR